jgi:hypothetical protein
LLSNSGSTGTNPISALTKIRNGKKARYEIKAETRGHSPTVVTSDLHPQIDPESPLPEVAEGIQVQVNGVYWHYREAW